MSDSLPATLALAAPAAALAPGMVAVLVASLIGSLHCVAMCGPLAALHHGAPPGQRWRGVALHQSGRALGYVVLGATAGALGKAVDLAGQALALQRAAMVIAAAGLAAWGLMLGIGALRARRPDAAAATGGDSLFSRGLVKLRASRRPKLRALALGLLNAVLPCGWLWAFVALAAGTGSVTLGAGTMFAFWLGTMPALLGATALATPLLARVRSRWPLVTAALVLGLAGATLLLRLPLLSPQPGKAASCHDPSAVPAATLEAPR